MRKLILFIVGIVAISLGIFIIVSGNKLAKVCTEETVATVVAVTREETTDSDGYTSYEYYPQIEYKAGEQTVSTRGNATSDSSQYKENDQIEILYNPNNVEEFIVKGDNSSRIGGIIWIVIGVIVLLVGVKQLIFGR